MAIQNLDLLSKNLAICTLVTLPTFSIGSAEMVDGESFNILTASDDASSILTFGCDATGPYLAASDGTTTIKAYTTWPRGAHNLVGFRTNDDGSQFGLIWRRYDVDGTPIDLTLQESALSPFSGALVNSDWLRFGFMLTGPLGIRVCELWDKSATNEEVLRIEKELP